MDHSKRPNFASQRYREFVHNTYDWNTNNSFYYQNDFIHQMVPRYQFYNPPRFYKPTYKSHKRSNYSSYKNRFPKVITQSKPNNASNTNNSISDKASEIFDKVLGKQVSETQKNVNTKPFQKKPTFNNRKRKNKKHVEKFTNSSTIKKTIDENRRKPSDIVPCTSKEPSSIIEQNTASTSKTCTKNTKLLNNNSKKLLETKNKQCKLPKINTTQNDIGQLSVSSSSVSSSSEDELFHQPIHPTNKPLSSSIPVQLVTKSPPRNIKPIESSLNYDIRGMSVAELKKLVTEPCSKLTQAKMNLMMKDMLKKKKVPMVTPVLDEAPDIFASLDLSNVELKPIEVTLPEVKEAISLALDSTNVIAGENSTDTNKDSEKSNRNEMKKKKSTKNSDAKTSKKVASKEDENISKGGESAGGVSINLVEMHVDNYVEDSSNETQNCNNSDTTTNYNHDNINTTNNNSFNNTTTTDNNYNENNSFYIEQNNINNNQNSNDLATQQNDVNNSRNTMPRTLVQKDSTMHLVLEMTVREEEIRQQIDRITYEENQLQKAINDFSNKLNAHNFFKNMLISESERLKSYRLKLLKDSVETFDDGSTNVPATSEGAPNLSLQYPEKVVVIQPTNLPSLISDSDSDESYENYSNSKKRRDSSPGNSKSTNDNSRDTSKQNNELFTSDKNNNETAVSSSSVTYIGSVNRTNISQSLKTNKRKKH